MIPSIDAHTHFWRLDRGDYSWLTRDLAPIYRDFGPDELRPFLACHGIASTILVQAAASVAETRYLLELARQTPCVAGVVGWADFEAPEAADTIAELAADPLLVGMRPMVQDIADDDWLLRPTLAPAFRALIAHDLAFDALTLPRHLPRLVRLLDRHPDLRAIVDHGSKPAILERRLDPWRADMVAVASRAGVHCKISGLATEAGPDWSVDDLMPYVEHLVDTFTAGRLVWGSDWPVVNLAGGYDRWRAATKALLAPLPEAEQAHVLGGNAARFYLARRGRR
jgi:L-fuconolactonase